MKKIQIFNLLLLLMLLASSKMLAMYPSQNKVIPMHKEKGHLRARTEEPSIVANLQQGMLIVVIELGDSIYVGAFEL